MTEYDDIDLRPYIRAVAKRWLWIVIAIALSAVVAGIISVSLPKEYSAKASVLVFVRQTGLQMSQSEALFDIETIDVNARRQGLLALAQSNAIEANIAPDLLSQVVPHQYKPGMLVQDNYIKVELKGDLLEIVATARSAERAKLLADAWAKTFVSLVDQLYTDQHSRVQLASSAVLPYKPTDPKIFRNIVLAGFVSGLASIVLVLAFEILRPSIMGGRFSVQSKRTLQNPSPSP